MRFQRQLAVFVLILSSIVALHWVNGTFQSEFGRYPDEGMHYVTGLMIRDYLTGGAPLHPMRFALNYYLHYPKVGLGNWPPLFPIMQTAWTLIAGVSRPSMMMMMCMVLAILAFVVYREAEKRFGSWPATLAVALLICAPLTQEQTEMVMAEIPLALLSLLAILRLVSFLDTQSWSDALAFGALTAAAILTKGNAWVVVLTAPLGILLSGNAKRVFHPRFLTACALILGICAPYQYVTRNILSQGWNQQGSPSLPYALNSLWLHTKYATQVLGVPLTLIAVVGFFGFVLIPWSRGRAESFWLLLATYAGMILVFHSVVPTSIEPRKIYQLAPVLTLFVIAGLAWISKRTKKAVFPVYCIIAAVVFFLGTFTTVKGFNVGLRSAVELIQSRKETKDAAILFSSNPIYTDMEAAFISTWIERERLVDTYLVRATKLLSQPGSGDGSKYPSLYQTPDAVAKALDAVPIAYVVIHTVNAEESYPHHDLLKAALTGHPEQWEQVHHSSISINGATNRLLIYRNSKPWKGVPVTLNIDMTRKIGNTVGTAK